MKIGVFTDVHANLAALKAVLAELQARGCREYICMGDVIGIGPQPDEAAVCLAELENLTCVWGNHDLYFVQGLSHPLPDGMGAAEGAHHAWAHARLSETAKRFLRGLPGRVMIERGGVRISAGHYAAGYEDGDRTYYPNPAEADFEGMFAPIEADVFLFGHDHAPAQVQKDGRLYANPGSLGCPHRGGAFARAGVLDIEDGSVVFERLEIPYDVSVTTRLIREYAYPAMEEILPVFFGESL